MREEKEGSDKLSHVYFMGRCSFVNSGVAVHCLLVIPEYYPLITLMCRILGLYFGGGLILTLVARGLFG